MSDDDVRPSRWRRMGRGLAIALGWASAAAGIAWVVLGTFPDLQILHPWAAMAASFIPYGLVAWVAVAAVLLTSPRRAAQALALFAVAALALQVSWTRTYWPHAPAVSTANLTVVALNTYYGWSDVDQLVAEAERTPPDVVVLSEVTHGTWDALQKRGWEERLPYHVGASADGWSSGAMMVFSRYPIRLVGGDTDGAWATIETATSDGPLTVIAVHTTNPGVDFRQWQADLAEIRREAEARSEGPLVVLGDFNAVREHQPLRSLADTGLTNVAESAGAGWVPTWPSRRYDRAITAIPYPSLIGIDHVFAGPGVEGAGFRTFVVDRTDHLGVVAELSVDRWR